MSQTSSVKVSEISSKKRKIVFEILSGPMDGEIFEIIGNKIRLGRSEDNELSISLDSLVSATHSTITFDGSDLWIEDEKSRNGTYLNTGKITGKVKLSCNDIITLGKTEIKIQNKIL